MNFLEKDGHYLVSPLALFSVDQDLSQGWVLLMILIREFNNVSQIRKQLSVLQVVLYGIMSIHMENKRNGFKRLGL